MFIEVDNGECNHIISCNQECNLDNNIDAVDIIEISLLKEFSNNLDNELSVFSQFVDLNESITSNVSTVISDDSDDDLNTETCNEAKQVNELLLAMQQCEEQLNVHAKSFNQATPVKMSKSRFEVTATLEYVNMVDQGFTPSSSIDSFLMTLVNNKGQLMKSCDNIISKVNQPRRSISRRRESNDFFASIFVSDSNDDGDLSDGLNTSVQSTDTDIEASDYGGTQIRRRGPGKEEFTIESLTRNLELEEALHVEEYPFDNLGKVSESKDKLVNPYLQSYPSTLLLLSDKNVVNATDIDDQEDSEDSQSLTQTLNCEILRECDESSIRSVASTDDMSIVHTEEVDLNKSLSFDDIAVAEYTPETSGDKTGILLFSGDEDSEDDLSPAPRVESLDPLRDDRIKADFTIWTSSPCDPQRLVAMLPVPVQEKPYSSPSSESNARSKEGYFISNTILNSDVVNVQNYPSNGSSIGAMVGRQLSRLTWKGLKEAYVGLHETISALKYQDTEEIVISPTNNGVSTAALRAAGKMCKCVTVLECVVRPDVELKRIMGAVLRSSHDLNYKFQLVKRNYAVVSRYSSYPQSSTLSIQSVFLSKVASVHLSPQEDHISDVKNKRQLRNMNYDISKKVNKVAESDEDGWDIMEAQVCVSRELQQRVLLCIFIRRFSPHIITINGDNTSHLSKNHTIQDFKPGYRLISVLQKCLISSRLSLSSLYTTSPSSVCSNIVTSPTDNATREDGEMFRSDNLDNHFLVQLQSLYREQMWSNLQLAFKSLDEFTSSAESITVSFVQYLEPIFKQHNIEMNDVKMPTRVNSHQVDYVIINDDYTFSEQPVSKIDVNSNNNVDSSLATSPLSLYGEKMHAKENFPGKYLNKLDLKTNEEFILERIDDSDDVDGMTKCLRILSTHLQRLKTKYDQEFATRLQQYHDASLTLIHSLNKFRSHLLKTIAIHPNALTSSLTKAYKAVAVGFEPALPLSSTVPLNSYSVDTFPSKDSDSTVSVKSSTPPTSSTVSFFSTFLNQTSISRHKGIISENSQLTVQASIPQHAVLYYCACLISGMPGTFYVTPYVIAVNFGFLTFSQTRIVIRLQDLLSIECTDKSSNIASSISDHDTSQFNTYSTDNDENFQTFHDTLIHRSSISPTDKLSLSSYLNVVSRKGQFLAKNRTSDSRHNFTSSTGISGLFSTTLSMATMTSSHMLSSHNTIKITYQQYADLTPTSDSPNSRNHSTGSIVVDKDILITPMLVDAYKVRFIVMDVISAFASDNRT